MEAEIRKASGQPDEYSMFALQAAASASRGRLNEARTLQRRAIDLARKRDMPEVAAGLVAEAARREALFGNCRKAREYVAQTPEIRDWVVLVKNAQANALCGAADEARKAAERLALEYPDNAPVQNLHLPAIRAMIQIRSGDPAHALATLNDVSKRLPAPPLWPAYLAGEAYLAQGEGSKAETEFRKVIERAASEEPFSPIYVLAQLGISKATRLSGELAESRESYQKLFALLKSADPDLPLLQQARAEYSTL